MTDINDILGTNVEPQFQPVRTGDVKHSLADIGKATRLLGYKPSVSFRDGLAATVSALQDARS
jgi:nucleoside-diphosphate-sugar epimerase